MRPTLYGLTISPWTERARWALDHHGITYQYQEHLPLVGELLLRRKAGLKKPSVPLFVDGRTVVMGSFEIAKHAEGAGRGAPLFPRDRDVELERWVDVAERMTRVARAWFMKRFSASPPAQAEALPSFVPGALRSVLGPSAAMATRFLVRKYDVPVDADAEVEHTLRPLLLEVRAAVAAGDAAPDGRRYLLGQLSYADMAVASTLQALRPRAAAPLGPATREVWTNEPLAREFEDLLAWRDAIYAKHR